MQKQSKINSLQDRKKGLRGVICLMYWFHYYKMASHLLLWLNRASLFVCPLSRGIISRTAGSPPSPERRRCLTACLSVTVQKRKTVRKSQQLIHFLPPEPFLRVWSRPFDLALPSAFAGLVFTLPYRMSAVYLSGYKTKTPHLCFDLPLKHLQISLLAYSVTPWMSDLLCLWLSCLHTRCRRVDRHAGGGVDGCPLVYSSPFHHIGTVDE